MNPYSALYTELDVQHEKVMASFTNAENKLKDAGAPSTEYIDIAYVDDGTIIRISDGSRINSLSAKEQLQFYPHLNQLFKKAANNKLYGEK